MAYEDGIDRVRRFGIMLLILGLAPASASASTPLLGAKGQTVRVNRPAASRRLPKSVAQDAATPRVVRPVGAKGQTSAMLERVRRAQSSPTVEDPAAVRWRERVLVAAKTSGSRTEVDPLGHDPLTCSLPCGPQSHSKSLRRLLARSSPGPLGHIPAPIDTNAGRSRDQAGGILRDHSFGSTFTPHASYSSLLQRWAC